MFLCRIRFFWAVVRCVRWPTRLDWVRLRVTFAIGREGWRN